MLAEAQVERGHDEQVEQGRCEQPAEDDDRQRVLDLVAGDLARDHQRHHRQPGGQRGHQDRREPFPRAAQDQPWTEGLALVALEVLVVVDQQDAVAGTTRSRNFRLEPTIQRSMLFSAGSDTA
jgi:hypothetical protein